MIVQKEKEEGERQFLMNSWEVYMHSINLD